MTDQLSLPRPARRTQAERRDESGRSLVEAAIAVVARQGVNAATFDAIGRQAGYSRGLATQRFGSKQGLIEAVIRHYASAGVRGHLVQVLDPAEEDLPFDGHVKFEGLEAEGQHTIRRVETVRGAYGARLAAQREGLQRLARPANWTVHLHRTDKPPQTEIGRAHV